MKTALITRRRGFLAADSRTYNTSDGHEPSLVLDFCEGYFATRELTVEEYSVGGVTPSSGTLPSLVLDFENDFFGTRDLKRSDFNTSAGTEANLVLDFGNDFYGASE